MESFGTSSKRDGGMTSSKQDDDRLHLNEMMADFIQTR